jgi:hypothetical protein
MPCRRDRPAVAAAIFAAVFFGESDRQICPPASTETDALPVAGEVKRSTLICMAPMSCRQKHKHPQVIWLIALLADDSPQQIKTLLVSISK